MADEKDRRDSDDSHISDGIHYSLNAGYGSSYGSGLARAQDAFETAMYQSRARAEREEERKRIRAARAKTERLNRERTERLQAERDAEAEANAEAIKQRYQRKFSGKMTSDDFEKWWKSNKLRLIEEDARENERVFLSEARRGEFGTM